MKPVFGHVLLPDRMYFLSGGMTGLTIQPNADRNKTTGYMDKKTETKNVGKSR